MEKTVQFGLGFVTGRPNVCKIINNTYENLINQFENTGKKVELTVFVLFDLQYQETTRMDFYELIPKVYKNIKIKYITPENIEELKKRLVAREQLTKQEADLFFGHGHAKGRNTLMYYAKMWNIDYLLFWDDDEYPVACIKNQETGEIIWKEQNNVAIHLKYIEDADITIGYHCGYISPIPYVEINKEINEDLFREYIEAISNEVVSWDSIKQKFIKDNGVTYADEKIANGEGAYELKQNGAGKWVVGSTLCLNLKNIERIPAFYNPPGARGEDTFFSTLLSETKVIKVPVYHFHDGFLKYTCIMKKKYPKTLRKIKIEEELIPQRFLQASRGWIKYKPLLTYISDRSKYKENIQKVKEQLDRSVPEINKLFGNHDFNILLEDLEEYSSDVEKHYKEYLKTNDVWNKLKIGEK